MTFEQAKGMAEALLTGDPDEAGIITETAQSVAAELVTKTKNAFTSHDDGRH